MRKILVGVVTLVSLMMPLQASAEDSVSSAEALLHQMDEASVSLVMSCHIYSLKKIVLNRYAIVIRLKMVRHMRTLFI